MNPIVAAIRALFESILACIGLSLIMLLISSLILVFVDKIKTMLFHSTEEDDKSNKPLIILTLLQMAIVLVLVFPGKYIEYTSPSYIKWNIAEHYEKYYPMTWDYIFKYSDEPYDYIIYYDKVWGDLQKYNGDGIAFDTLSSYEQSIVHYPDIGEFIYYTSDSHTYHSTSQCYTLLRSEPSFRPSRYAYMYDPCSKCVGD